MLEDDTPEMLYHYTSLENFISIITSKTLRLYDITKSNDSHEITWIVHHIRNELNDAYAKRASERTKGCISASRWIDLCDHFIEDTFTAQRRYYGYYVICFSQDDDQLSQWRGYANDGKGVCIGLDATRLGSIEAQYNLHTDVVDYNNDHQREIVRKIVDQLIHDIDDLLSDDGIAQADQETLTPRLMKLFNRAFYHLFEQSITMKNPLFNEEKETRLSCMTSKSDIRSSRMGVTNTDSDVSDQLRHSIYYEARDNTITSYLELSLTQRMENVYNPLIRSIRLGPKCNVTKEELRDMLYYYRIPNAEDKLLIEESKLTYR